MKTKSFISIIIVLLIFLGCSKYEDGPLISFRSKEKRLINTWEVKSITNLSSGAAVSTSDYINSELDISINNIQIDSLNVSVLNFLFLEDNECKYKVTFTSSYNPFPLTYLLDGTWEFSGDTDLIVTLQYDGDSDTETYKILRLAKDELWMKDTEYEFHLIPVE